MKRIDLRKSSGARPAPLGCGSMLRLALTVLAVVPATLAIASDEGRSTRLDADARQETSGAQARETVRDAEAPELVEGDLRRRETVNNGKEGRHETTGAEARQDVR